MCDHGVAIASVTGSLATAAATSHLATKLRSSLMLTARGDPIDRMLGLQAGADDYLAKPFEKRELVTRHRALLRHRVQQIETPPALGSLVIDPLRREVSAQGQVMTLTSTPFTLLLELTRVPGQVVTREQLSKAVQADGHAFVPPGAGEADA